MQALIFDLDGTLVDTVYAHIFAWQQALAEADMGIDGWRIHRRIGMSGGLFTRAVGRELGHPTSSLVLNVVFNKTLQRRGSIIACRSCWNKLVQFCGIKG